VAVKWETQVLIAGAAVISLLICVLGLRQESALGPIDIHAAAKKGWAPMKGATRRPPKHSIPHPPERKGRLAYVTWHRCNAYPGVPTPSYPPNPDQQTHRRRRERLRKTGHRPTHRIPVLKQRLTASHERATLCLSFVLRVWELME